MTLRHHGVFRSFCPAARANPIGSATKAGRYHSLTKPAHTFSPWFLHEQESGGEEYAGTVPSHRRRKRRNGHELAATETGMLNQLLQGELPTLLVQAQNSPTVARMKKLLLVMLGIWMSYFLLVNWFVHSLNKIAVPVIDIPLGTYLAVQGAVIMFGVALFRFVRTAG